MQGELAFTFSLVYTSTEEVLPQLEALLAVARLDDSKEGTRQAEQRLAAIIQVLHPAGCAASRAAHLYSWLCSSPAQVSAPRQHGPCSLAETASRVQHAEQGHLVQEHEANERFNPGWLEDESEHIVLETVGSVITPLCRQRGRIVLTPLRLYFQPFNVVSDAPLQVSSLAKARPLGLG